MPVRTTSTTRRRMSAFFTASRTLPVPAEE